MLYIGILSDTHGYLNPALKSFFEPCDEIWHVGDWGNWETMEELLKWKPVRGVFGNIDGKEVRGRYPQDLVFMAEEVKVWMTHIAGYPGHYGTGIKSRIKQIRPDLLICGHSHILRVMKDNAFGMMYFNPGAAGIHGFQQKCTALRLRIEGKRMFGMEVWEQSRNQFPGTVV